MQKKTTKGASPFGALRTFVVLFALFCGLPGVREPLIFPETALCLRLRRFYGFSRISSRKHIQSSTGEVKYFSSLGGVFWKCLESGFRIFYDFRNFSVFEGESGGRCRQAALESSAGRSEKIAVEAVVAGELEVKGRDPHPVLARATTVWSGRAA